MTTRMSEGARRRLRDAPPEALLSFETYQDAAALAKLLEDGVLTGGPDYGDRDEDWRAAYEWMRERMASAISGFSGNFPIWGWPRPLRLTRDEAEAKAGLWRVRALVPRGRVLPSCFALWHHPLNGWSIDDDAETWASNWHAPPEVKRESWHKCLEIAGRSPALIDLFGDADVVQLCLDGLLLKEVVEVSPVPIAARRSGRRCDTDATTAPGPLIRTRPGAQAPARLRRALSLPRSALAATQ